MEEAIENYRKARKRKKAAVCIMIVCMSLEVTATAVSVTLMEYMTLFLVVGLVVGGCGVAVFFMENLKCNDREEDLAKLLVLSCSSYEEMCQKASQLKVSKTALQMFLSKPQAEEAKKASVKGKNKYKKEK